MKICRKMAMLRSLAMLVGEGTDSLEAQITNSEGKGILIKISYHAKERWKERGGFVAI